MYKLFRNLNMFWKFTIFGLIAAVLPTLAAIQSYNSMQTSKQNLDMFVEQNMALGFVVNEMYAHGLQTGQAVRNIIMNPVDDKAVANLNAANKDFTDAQQKALELTKIIGKYEDLLSKVPAIWQKDANLKEQVVVLAQSGEQASAIELLVKQETPVWREVRSTLLEAKKVIQEDIIVLKEKIDHKNATNLKITVAILFIAIIMINVIMLIFWRLLQSSLDQMLERLKDIASGDGDLTRRLEVNGRDELAQSAYWLNQFMEKLSNTLCSVSSTINNLNNATTSLNNTSDQMAANAAEVSSQAVSVATASEEMAATSNDIAHNCHAAAESANNAAQTTERGFAVVQQTITGIRSRGEMTKRNAESVSSLGERSEQIGAIASTIEDIADQTNLLALNAAIEAARAGEMGRGFAVVADEVRALAERTTRATHEISVMIRNIQSETQQAIVSMEEGVKDTEKGVADAAQLESALHDILERVNDVTMQVSQIATAAEEQTATTSEITNNIHRISDVVEDTSKGASETAAASDSLYQISEELRRLMSQFKLSA